MKYILSFDGACEPINPGGVATYGYTIAFENGERKGYHGVIGEGDGMTCNVAEYGALIKGLQRLSHIVAPKDEILIQGDSQLIIYQMIGKYRVNAENLKPLHTKAKKLIDNLKSNGVKIEFKWVNREFNAEADRLSKLGYKEYVKKK
jgi:ribonuclease HI